MHGPCEGCATRSNIAILIETDALEARDPREGCALVQNKTILVESGELDVHD